MVVKNIRIFTVYFVFLFIISGCTKGGDNLEKGCSEDPTCYPYIPMCYNDNDCPQEKPQGVCDGKWRCIRGECAWSCSSPCIKSNTPECGSECGGLTDKKCPEGLFCLTTEDTSAGRCVEPGYCDIADDCEHQNLQRPLCDGLWQCLNNSCVWQCNDSDYQSCVVDSDCIKVQSRCCPCDDGGGEFSINVKRVKDWFHYLSVVCDTQKSLCTGIYTCKEGEAVCNNGVCSIKSSCQDVSPNEDCSGKWIESGVDETGCMLPPVCVPLEYCNFPSDCAILENYVDFGCNGHIRWDCIDNICNAECIQNSSDCTTNDDCGEGEACIFSDTNLQGYCMPVSDCSCEGLYSPVCGDDGYTYPNRCIANCLNVKVKYQGECGKDCPSRFSPYCGFDGVTYFNRCLLDRSNVRPAYRGFCRLCKDDSECNGIGWCKINFSSGCPEVKNCSLDSDCNNGICIDGICVVSNPPADCDCPLVDYPVCGKNGVTYINSCILGCYGVAMAFEGVCTVCNTDENVGLCLPSYGCTDVSDCDQQDIEPNISCDGFWMCKNNQCIWSCGP